MPERSPLQRRRDVNQAAEAFRRDVIAGERSAAVRLARAYSRAFGAIQMELELVLGKIAAARAAGQEVGPAWLFQAGRLQELERQTLIEISRFAQEARLVIGAEQATAARQGSEAASQMIALASPAPIIVAPGALTAGFASLPTAAIETIVGTLTQGAALDALLASFGAEAAQRISTRLIQGIALGQNPRKIARLVREDMGGSLSRALTISRTEVMRAWRESARATYRANGDVVRGWIWWSALDRTTCASCLAQHGSRHPASEVMATHPRCRCVPIPDVDPSFGLPDVETGTEWFARQPPELQAEVLAPGKLAAYRGNRVRLDDMVAHRDSPVWGPSTSEAGLQHALANAEARRAAARVAA